MKAFRPVNVRKLALVVVACAGSGCQEIVSDSPLAGGGAGTVGVRVVGAQTRSAARQSGTLAISANGTSLYVADTDNDALLIVRTAERRVVKRVLVGREPTRVIVGPDGSVYVSNRQDRSVSVVDPVVGVEKKRIGVGTEPTGMALLNDGVTLLVANNTNATLSAINLPTLTVRATIPTSPDPDGLAVQEGGSIYVTCTRSPLVHVLNDGTFEETRTISLDVPLPTSIAARPRSAGQAIAPVVAKVIYFPFSSSDISFLPTENAPDSYASGILGVPVVAPALATFSTSLLGSWVPPAAGAAPPTVPLVRNQALSGPSAAAVDSAGRFLFIVYMNSNNVQIIDVSSGVDLSAPIAVGAGPNGIATAPSADRAYVYNSFDHSITQIERMTAGKPAVVQTFTVGTSPLTPAQDLGRRLFFSAADSRMTDVAAGGIACASCHPGGRDDGRTWQFSEGRRNTPMLAGRHLATTAPYHWDGALATPHDFNKVIQERMGGAGDGTGRTAEPSDRPPLTDADFDAILAYLDSLSPPDNPYRDEADPAAVARGHELFAGKAGCAGCHVEETNFTDNGFHAVSFVDSRETFPMNHMVNTPTLRSLFATAPYLHDGSVPTIAARVRDDRSGSHGTTSGLTTDERDDLVTYLKTL